MLLQKILLSAILVSKVFQYKSKWSWTKKSILKNKKSKGEKLFVKL